MKIGRLEIFKNGTGVDFKPIKGYSPDHPNGSIAWFIWLGIECRWYLYRFDSFELCRTLYIIGYLSAIINMYVFMLEGRFNEMYQTATLVGLFTASILYIWRYGNIEFD